MLYYAIELRHEPAFYGVFQAIGSLFGGSWPFLGSLSDPDRFIPLFGQPKPISLLLITLDFQYLNILPLLMGVVFFFQQKLTTPPATTDQARQQQMMMKFMVLLFPVFLYSAPSGLTLYILASTAAGIVDSYLVRKHVKQQEASGELFKAKPRRRGGLMDRLAKAAEQKQRMLTERGKKAGASGGGRPRKRRA
jgi:YidC/Oxa1 family membrane protein insertase